MSDSANVPALSILGQRTSSGRDRIWQCRREPHGTTSIRGVAMMSVAASSALDSRSRIATIPGANSRKAAHDRLPRRKRQALARRSCSNKKIEQDGDSTIRRLAPAGEGWNKVEPCRDGARSSPARISREFFVRPGTEGLVKVFAGRARGPMETRKYAQKNPFRGRDRRSGGHDIHPRRIRGHRMPGQHLLAYA